ncbi:MAG TPA: YcnI family protein [Streptosporangiaceae bacterium]|jgi:uncharacterized protein YcnI
MSVLAKVFAVGAASALAVLAVATPASAHVTANPDTAEQGSFTKVSFRVPNEEDKANTTKVEINLPLDHPIAAVSVRPVPGWTVSVQRSKLPQPVKSDDGEVTEAVSKITWSKGTIKPGEFQEFDVSMGPLPTDTDTLMFKAIQTYSGGPVVRWDQPRTPGGEEPEHPAPALHLTKPSQDGDTHGAAGSPAPKTSAAADSSAADSGSGDDGTARLLAGLGLATGVIGILVAVVALTRGRRQA